MISNIDTKKSKIQKTLSDTPGAKENSNDFGRKEDSNTVPIYRYKDINFSNVEISELTNKTGRQPLSYIHYNDPKYPNMQRKILVQSGWIKLTYYGIPSLDAERGFYTEDSHREFIKIPLDPGQEACNDLKNHLEEADEWAGSDTIRKKLLGKRANNYEYQSCIRTPQPTELFDDSDNPKNKKTNENNPLIDYVKMKFNMIPSDNKERINQTKLIRRNKDNSRTVITAKTITEIANEIRYQSEIRFIFMYSKIWVNNTKLKGASKLLYGIGFKLMAIEYIPNSNKSINIDKIDFRLSDEENENEEIVKPVIKPKAKFDDSDSEEIMKNENLPKKSDNESDKTPNNDSDEEDSIRIKKNKQTDKYEDDKKKGKSKRMMQRSIKERDSGDRKSVV